MTKQLEDNSLWAEADLDGDGVVTDKEIELFERKVRFENEDKKEDASATWRGLHCLVCCYTLLLSC